jgi:hypothetical protein
MFDKINETVPHFVMSWLVFVVNIKKLFANLACLELKTGSLIKQYKNFIISLPELYHECPQIFPITVWTVN